MVSDTVTALITWAAIPLVALATVAADIWWTYWEQRKHDELCRECDEQLADWKRELHDEWHNNR